MANSKSEIISGNIRDKIISKQYKRGDKLPTEMMLAESYGVSRQTIRKALATLVDERLLESIQGSGYYVLYSSPTYRRSMSITVITSYISEYIFPSILRGIEQTASERGYSITIRATNNSISMERQILEDMINNPADGILAEATKSALPNPNTGYYEQLADNGIPIVFFNSSYPRLHHSSIRSVVTDDYDGGRTLVQYLAEKGIKRIGGLFKSDDIQGTLRFSGFIDAVMKAGLPFSDKNVGWFTTETRDRIPEVCSGTIRSILSECEAVICYNDEVADILAGIMASVPPEETSIRYIGSFDNVISLHGLSGISTVSLGYPRDRMGRLITEKLINMLDGHHEESLVLPWTNE